MSFAGFYDCNIFFSSDDNEGWSEHYILQAADAETAATDLAALIPLRAACLHSSFQIDGGRVSEAPVHGDSYPIGGVTFPVVGSYSPTDVEGTIANTALKVRLLAGAPFKGLIYFRGLSEDLTQNRHYVPNPTFVAAFTAYRDHIVGSTNGYMIDVEDPPGSGVMAMKQIVDVAIMGVTSRKPGRPFGLPVGRRRSTTAILASAAKKLRASGRATELLQGSSPVDPPSPSGGTSARKGPIPHRIDTGSTH